MKNKIELNDEGVMSKNSKDLRKFVLYCLDHPEERFWQALINWYGKNISSVTQDSNGKTVYIDLFYKE